MYARLCGDTDKTEERDLPIQQSLEDELQAQLDVTIGSRAEYGVARTLVRGRVG